MSANYDDEATCNLEAAARASNNPLWLDVVSDVYRQAFFKRDLDVAQITPVPHAFQAESVDYHVTLANPYTGQGFQSYCELKTERLCYGRISVETWSVKEKDIEGWPWKLTDINEQRLCTIWWDGLVFFPYLDAYKCWLADNRETLEAKADDAREKDYKRFSKKNYSATHGAYTSHGFTIPISELQNAFGTHCWYQLEGISLKRAQEGIDEITKANAGASK